jgi:hypothetical protein
VHALAVDGAQLVAVGATADGLMAWTSPDAVTWDPHAVPQSSTLDEWREDADRISLGIEPGFESMGQLARLGDTLFSFGTFAAMDNDVLRPVGWRSADGTEWESIKSENVFFAEGGAVMDLVAGGPGLLALTRGPVHQYGGGIWVWTAETSWVQTTPLDVVWESVTGGAVVWDTVWADGKYVAVGLAASYAPARTWASSWVSTDGRSWQATPPSADREEAVMYAVSPVTGGGFVAVGCERCPEGQLGTPAAWISPDGLAWTAVALPADFEGAANGVVQLGSGLLAFGDAPNGTATWTSADGVNWQAGPNLAGNADGHNLVVWRDGVVLFLYGEVEYGVPHDSLLLRGIVQP